MIKSKVILHIYKHITTSSTTHHSYAINVSYFTLLYILWASITTLPEHLNNFAMINNVFPILLTKPIIQLYKTNERFSCYCSTSTQSPSYFKHTCTRTHTHTHMLTIMYIYILLHSSRHWWWFRSSTPSWYIVNF